MDPSQSRATRRSFRQAATTGAGLGVLAHAVGGDAAAGERPAADAPSRLPREVWVASITQDGMHAANYERMIKAMLARMESVVPFRPDIVCLPEVFPFVNRDTDPACRISTDSCRKKHSEHGRNLTSPAVASSKLPAQYLGEPTP